MLKAPIEKRELGMTPLPDGGARMLFWSPIATSAGIEVTGKGYLPLAERDYGYWEGVFPGIGSGDRYMVVTGNDKKFPDPVSLSQPDGVHAPSEVIDTGCFSQTDTGWKGVDPADLVIYELHTGTFSPKGNFEGIKDKLDYLANLGINAIELMPVAAFPGSRNWGYDGVYPFAVHSSYGGAKGLADLVEASHKQDIAVILDVVYNHLGPEGNYLPVAGPYFTDKYRTPWGSAINFDDAWSDGVRRYFIENALMWLRDFGIDGLRLDAVHAIKDNSTRHFLSDLSESVERLNGQTGKNHFLIGECDLNDVRYITPSGKGGMGLDAQWCDEFHHALHTRITGERNGYYSDFGKTSQIADSFNNAYVYDGKYSTHRKKLFGSPTTGMPGNRFVVFTQNHDQTGNRMLGERLSSLTDFETLKLAAGAMFVSPFIPMIFMGEEYGEKAPFLYFTSHSDNNLIESVREGRKKEFAEFIVDDAPPDPQADSTFKRSMLSWDFGTDDKKERLLKFYKKMITLKRTHPALKPGKRKNVKALEACNGKAIIISLENNNSQVTALMNFSEESIKEPCAEGPQPGYNVLLYSAHTVWGGPVNEFASLIGNDGMINIEPRSILILSDI